jgi:arylsulfatase A-like enzyme
MLGFLSRWFFVAAVLVALSVPETLFADPSGKSSRPNIVVILADDLGAEAIGCYGGAEFLGDKGRVLGAVKTPNIDAMAREGMLFSKAFATPVCSPSRAQFLTGKYNFRIGFHDIAGRNGAAVSLDASSHPTVAALLQEAGYLTGVTGKWHIGPTPGLQEPLKTADQDTSVPHVRECGFARQFIVPGAHLRHYGKPVEGEYTPDLMNEWAYRFFEQGKKEERPFFLFYSSPLPHFPYWPTPLNPDGPYMGDLSNEKLAGMYGNMENWPYLVEYLDKQVGQLLAKLDGLGMRGNTLVFFLGDNGTPPWVTTRMRDGRKIKFGKGTMNDTGSWVPFLASWPDVIKPGSRYDGLVDFSDITPTILRVAGVAVPEGLDGQSFAPQLEGKDGTPREWVHTLFNSQYFVRNAGWKLRETGELFDMSDAPYSEKLVRPEDDTAESKAARAALGEVAARLHPPAP